MDVVEQVLAAAQRKAPNVRHAVVQLVPAGLVDAHTATTLPLASLDRVEVFAVAGIANPDAFRRQLQQLGARVRLHAVGDHHPYDADEATALARAGATAQMVVCTLKDAVKLAPLWPRGGPGLWYLTQEVILERGRPEIDRIISGVLEARARYTTTVGEQPAQH
jgi:tetraacyldisaccharide 4'-kinase